MVSFFFRCDVVGSPLRVPQEGGGLEAAFKEVDTNGSGELDFEEFVEFLSKE